MSTKTALEFINHQRGSNPPFQRPLDPVVSGWSSGDVVDEAHRLGWEGACALVASGARETDGDWTNLGDLSLGQRLVLVGRTVSCRGPDGAPVGPFDARVAGASRAGLRFYEDRPNLRNHKWQVRVAKRDPALGWRQLTRGVAKDLVGKRFEVRGKLGTAGHSVRGKELHTRLHLDCGNTLRADGRWWVREVA